MRLDEDDRVAGVDVVTNQGRDDGLEAGDASDGGSEAVDGHDAAEPDDE
jgi:hypothetical protein